MFLKRKEYNALLERISDLEEKMSKPQEYSRDDCVLVKDIFNGERYFITAYDGKLYFIKNPSLFLTFEGADGIENIDEAIKKLREDRDFLFKEFVQKRR